MSADRTRLARYGDGLIDPDARILATYKGVQWVTDRYAMVRTDMFKRPVTAKWLTPTAPVIKDANMRQILGGIPRNEMWAHRSSFVFNDDTRDRPRTMRIITTRYASLGGTLYDARIDPLLDACDHLALHKNRIAGFQKRPRSSRPVLVCVVMGVNWSALDSSFQIKAVGS